MAQRSQRDLSTVVMTNSSGLGVSQRSPITSVSYKWDSCVGAQP